MHLTTSNQILSICHLFSLAFIPLAAALACGFAGAQPTLPSNADAAYAPGRIIVMPRAGMPEHTLSKVLSDQGGGKVRRLGKSE